MTIYTVGVKLRARTQAVTIEAEGALLAALKIKLENPDALLTYVRKSNRRGDRRHPHESTDGDQPDQCHPPADTVIDDERAL